MEFIWVVEFIRNDNINVYPRTKYVACSDLLTFHKQYFLHFWNLRVENALNPPRL